MIKYHEAFKKDFLLDPEIHFFNHGSFGATPKPVFQAYQNWQRKLESNPAKFLSADSINNMKNSRNILGEYIGCDGKDLVYFPNPTTAINMVVRNLDLKPGDEILTTNHEYGAMNRTWKFLTKQNDAKYIFQNISVPVTNHEDFIKTFWKGITKNTKIIFMSHITSQTALTFPIKEICKLARENGIFTIIDGAHVPGHIPLNLTDIDPDVYTGACHKWLCAPKGSAFLYVNPKHQEWMNPLVVSWGYESEIPSDSQFIDYHEWQGTRDLAPFLTVPDAIKFHRDNNWHEVQESCHQLLLNASNEITDILQMPLLSNDKSGWFRQFRAFQLPSQTNIEALKFKLLDEHNVEVPVYLWNEKPYMRVSIQGYNTWEDIDALIAGLKNILL